MQASAAHPRLMSLRMVRQTFGSYKVFNYEGMGRVLHGLQRGVDHLMAEVESSTELGSTFEQSALWNHPDLRTNQRKAFA